MYKKPEPEDYLQRVKQATIEVPTDTAVALIRNMIAVTGFSKALARINRPMLFAYEPALQPNADFLKARLGHKVRLERFGGVAAQWKDDKSFVCKAEKVAAERACKASYTLINVCDVR